MRFRDYWRGAVAAGLSGFAAYVAVNYVRIDLGPLEPYRFQIALVAVALWNRFRSIIGFVRELGARGVKL